MTLPERLETERLTLRRHRRDDAEPIVESLNHWAVVQWLALVPWPYTHDHALDWIAITYSAWQAGSNYQLIIEDTPTRRVIGQVGLRVNPVSKAPARSAELGYWIREGDWGHGFGSEAARAMVAFGFQKLELDRIEATCLPANHRSLAVLIGLGLERQGMKDMHFIAQDAMLPALVFGLARSDWRRSAMPEGPA